MNVIWYLWYIERLTKVNIFEIIIYNNNYIIYLLIYMSRYELVYIFPLIYVVFSGIV